MRKTISLLVAFGVLASLLMTVSAAGAAADAGHVVVANRASGTISVIDVADPSDVMHVPLPAADNQPEPMYVVSSRSGDRVFVGDRANDRVVVFDGSDWAVLGTVSTGAGVFHMWGDPQGRQLWVNNDIDFTSTVIDPQSLEVLATVAMPADLVAAGYKPHDVFVSNNGRSAYVTLVGGVAHDWVVQFDTRTFAEKNRAAVGLDPHVTATTRALYVPAQNANTVHVLDLRTLSPITDLAIPGAHGAGMAPSRRVLYTTNLPGGGTDGLWAIDTIANEVIGSVDTAYPVPHNVVDTPSRRLFVTHSGATSDKVTVYQRTAEDPRPVAIGEVTVGLNPFGLAYVP